MDELQGRLCDSVMDVAWMRSNRLQLTCSGARRFAASIRFQPLRSRLARLPARYVLFAIILTILTMQARSLKLYWAVSRFFDEFAAFAGRWPNQFSRRLLFPWRVWITEARLLPVCPTASLLNRLQSVLHAATGLMYLARKYYHVTPLLCDLHWLRVPERMAYRLAVLILRTQHGTASPYLSAELTRVANADFRWRLRSSNTLALVILQSKHSMIGDCAFPVTVARVLNSLPPFVSSSPSLPVFKRRLTELYTR